MDLQPDVAWLQNPARVYPVFLDPSLVTTPFQPPEAAAQDKTICDSGSGCNDGGATSTTLYVGNNEWDEGDDTFTTYHYSYIQFADLDTLPGDSVVSSARLWLYGNGTGPSNEDIWVYDITSDWDETQLTWNNRPTLGSQQATLSTGTYHALYNPTTGPTGWKGFDLSGLARRWVAGEQGNFGVQLSGQGPTVLWTEPQGFWSSNYSNASLRPKLEVTYVTAGRYGIDSHWTYGPVQEYGGGTSSRVNLATGNLVVQHTDSIISSRGFDVALTHTYNSQDIYGSSDEANDPNVLVDPGDYFGTGWTFSYNLRLVEFDNGNAVRIKDGTGQWRVYYKDSDSGTTRTYKRPLYYGHTLTKDLANPPTDANNVFTFTVEKGLLKYFFAADGTLKRMEDRNGNFLTFTYDSGKLTTITDVAGRTTTLAYSGTPPLLSQITDMTGRVSTYGYTNGNLTGITHAAGTADAVTTTFSYDAAGQLTGITTPRGHTSNLTYKTEAEWETGGSVDGWEARPTCSGTSISQSAGLVYMGAGALALSFSGSSCGGARKTFGTAAPLNATRQELVGYVYVPAGAPTFTAKFFVEDDYGVQTNGTSFTLTAGGWNRVHWIDAPIDPALPVKRLGVDVSPTSGTYTGTLYLDQVFLRGVVYQQKDALPAHNVVAQYTYVPSKTQTVVDSPDQDGIMRKAGYTYNQWGWLTAKMQGYGFDDFNRADGALTADNSPSGHSWTAEASSSFTISGNLVRQDNGAADKVAYIDTGTGGNATLTARVRNTAVSGAGATVGLAARVVDTDNYLYAWPTRADHTIRLYKKVAGTHTQLSSVAIPNPEIYWHELRLVAHNDLIEVWLDGAKHISYTLTAGEYATFATTIAKHGITASTQTTAEGDDFRVNGRLTSYAYDANGRMTQMTPPSPSQGQATSFSYSYYNNTTFLNQVSNRNGGVMRYGVDVANGDDLYRIEPVQYALQLQSQPYSARVFIRDSAGNITSEQVNRYGPGNAPPTPLGLEHYRNTSYEYYPNAGGLRSRMIDPYGYSTRYDYDNGSRDKGYLTRVEYPPFPGSSTPRVETYVRNADGTVQQKTDPTNRATTYQYDNLGRLKQVNYGVVGGTPTYSVQTTYDANGNVASTTDGENRTTTYQYDANNRLTAVADTRLKTTSYEYYVNGLLKQVTDPDARTTTYTYDTLNRLLTEQNALNHTTTYRRDARGNVISRVDAKDVTTTYAYDAGDRVTTITYPGPTTVTFSYNADDQRTEMVDATGTTTYTYDNLAQLTAVTQPGANTFTYTYDRAGKVSSRSYPGTGDRSTTYTYLPGGLLGTARAPFVHAALTTYVYDAAGRPTVTTLPNGTTATSSYDNAGRLTLLENTALDGTVISWHAYTLDRAGNRTAVDEQNGAFTGVTQFTYDELNRLTEAVYPSNQSVNYRRVTYTLNDSGDRTALEQWTGSPGAWTQYGSTVTYTYDTAGRMTAAGGVTYTYDNNGNQTARGSDTFTWDVEN
ncbi:MAG: DNRLRE domain-containing protein, partial [Chloroflexi bacterium]|nr:DNRLRE domain-containing protein [Chloroflexota bacterium]